MHVYFIEIVGTCNLRCPSCPVGNYVADDLLGTEKYPLGFMSLEKFDAILAKIAADRGDEPICIYLLNWGEPLLHPKIAEFIKRVRKYKNIYCGISSNLSMKVDLNAVIAARPHWFRISLSGFNPSTYSRTHRRGDVELVKANMRKLREAIDRNSSKTDVEVCYHVYRHNAGEDMESMLRLSEELKFAFKPIWASFYPLEKVMSYVEGKVSDADAETIDMLALKPKELLAAAQAHKAAPCVLQQEQTAINHDGTVQLCCGTYDRAFVIARDFLATSNPELMERKRGNATCTKCIAGGYHAMAMYHGVEQVEHLANARIADAGSPYRLDANANLTRLRAG